MPCACGRNNNIQTVIRKVVKPTLKQIKKNISFELKSNEDKKVILRNFYLSKPVSVRESRVFKLTFINFCKQLLG